jgi:hypothetical protein
MDDNEIFKDENVKHFTRLPYEKYSLEISCYKVGEPENHYWDYTRGKVFDKNNNLLLDIKRNYSSFWHLFIEHPNGNDYFLCGRDYHGGYNIFDLTNQKEYAYNPIHEPYKELFCWISAEFNKDSQQLIVEGCYWACPFELVTFDFSNPTNIPLPEISRKDIEEDWEEDDCDDENEDMV